MEFISTLVAAEVLGVSETSLRNWRKQGDGPPFIIGPDGEMYYDRAGLHAWAIRRDVAQFLAFAERYAATMDMPVPLRVLPQPESLDELLTELLPVTAIRPKRKYTRRVKTARPVSTEPPPQSAPAEPVVSVTNMGPSQAIPAVLNTVHPEPMKYGDLLSYLKIGGYEGSLQGIGVAIQDLKAKGILKRTENGWVLNKATP